jgi:hypothetical protein
MKNAIFSVLIWFVHLPLFSQVQVDYNIDQFAVLKLTIPNQKYQVGYEHDCSILTVTNRYIVAKEVASSRYSSFLHTTYIVLHFFDKSSKKLVKHEIIYKANRYSRNVPENQSIDIWQDQKPHILTIKEKIFVLSGAFTKEQSQEKKMIACKVLVYDLKGLKVIKDIKYIHTNKVAIHWPFDAKVSVDSSFLMLRYKGFLPKESQVGSNAAFQLYDLEFNQFGFIPLHSANDFTGYGNFVFCIDPNKESKNRMLANYGYEVDILIYDIENDEMTRKTIQDFYHSNSRFDRINASIQVVGTEGDQIDLIAFLPLVLGKTRNQLIGSISRHQLLKFEFNTQSKTLDAPISTTISVVQLTESDASDQNDYQNAYLKAIADYDFNNEELHFQFGAWSQDFNDECTSFPVLMYKQENITKIGICSPQLIWINDMETMLALNCVINLDYNEFQTELRRPLIVSYDGAELTLLYNFTVPAKPKKEIVMSADNPQDLQLLHIDLDENEVIRENLTHHQDDKNSNVTYNISPTSAIIKENVVYCTTVDMNGKYTIATIKI